MKFSDIPARESVKRQLKEMAASGRVPHALLIHGQSGGGKFMLARVFAQLLHCEHPGPDGEPCEVCAQCQRHRSGNQLDTLMVFPVVKDEKHRAPVSDDYLEEFREFMRLSPYMDFDRWASSFDKKNAQPQIYVSESEALERRLAVSASTARYKIVLFWLPEKMNEAAANKLLKLLEEPAPDTVFIMVSNNASAILPTILSRCRPIEVLRLDDASVASVLEERLAMDSADALAVAHVALGDVNVALRSADATSVSRLFFDMFVSLMRLAYQRDVKALRQWSAELTALGRETEIKFYDYCQRLIRENFMFRFGVPDITYLNRQEQQFSQRFARFITERNAEAIIRHLGEASRDIAGNANGNIVNFDFAVKMIILIKNY